MWWALGFLCLMEGWQHQGDHTRRACLLFPVPGEEETKARGHGQIPRLSTSRYIVNYRRAFASPSRYLGLVKEALGNLEMNTLISFIGLRITKSPDLELSLQNNPFWVTAPKVAVFHGKETCSPSAQQLSTPACSMGLIFPRTEMVQQPETPPTPRTAPIPRSGSLRVRALTRLASLHRDSVREPLWQSLAGDVLSLPLHVTTSPGMQLQGSLNICFLNLGNSRSLSPCNTQSVSFIKSCPGKCLIHSCRRPTVGRARAFRTLGGGRQQWSAWQQPPGCFSNAPRRQGEDKTLQLFTCLSGAKESLRLYSGCQILRT